MGAAQQAAELQLAAEVGADREVQVFVHILSSIQTLNTEQKILSSYCWFSFGCNYVIFP